MPVVISHLIIRFRDFSLDFIDRVTYFILNSAIYLTNLWHCVPCSFASLNENPNTKGYTHFSPLFYCTDMSGDIICVYFVFKKIKLCVGVGVG